jgi:putative PEP-CTERM system TPR-repeat lipoprotein
LTSQAYQQSENHPQALKVLNKAEALDPNDPSLKQQKAVSLLAMGQTDQAMAELERAVTLSDKDARADISIITIDLQRNEFDKALKAIDTLEKKLPNKAFTHNLRAMAFLGKNDKTSARKSLERALTLDPKYVPAATSLAYLELSENHVDAARKRFEGILAQTPNNLQAMLGLANIALLNRQEMDHAAWLEKAVKAHPKAIQPRVLLSRYYLNKNEPAKALALAKEAVSNNPDDPNAIDFLAAMQLAGNNPMGAVDTYKKLITKAPDSGEAHYRLALALITAKNPAEGRASLNRALTLKPDLIPAMDTLIRLDLEEKQPGAALKWAKKIQALQPNASLGYEREGDILMAQNQAVMAAKAYQRAQDMRATSLGIIKLHTALTRAGDIKSAQAKLDEWVKTNPRDISARYYLASQAMLQGHDQLAITQFEEVLRQRPDNAESLNNLANLYQRANDPRALGLAEKAYKIQPQDPAIQDTLGWLWVEKGRPEKGLELLAKAAGQAPKIPTIQYHYAVALARTGDKSKASSVLQRTLAGRTDFPEAKAAQELLAKLK